MKNLIWRILLVIAVIVALIYGIACLHQNYNIPNGSNDDLYGIGTFVSLMFKFSGSVSKLWSVIWSILIVFIYLALYGRASIFENENQDMKGSEFWGIGMGIAIPFGLFIVCEAFAKVGSEGGFGFSFCLGILVGIFSGFAGFGGGIFIGLGFGATVGLLAILCAMLFPGYWTGWTGLWFGLMASLGVCLAASPIGIIKSIFFKNS